MPGAGIKKILVIENDSLLAQNLKFHLEQAKYKVLVANNGEEGFDLAKINLPNLIISGIDLRGINGFTICEELGKEEPTKNIPFIFLTTRSGQEDYARAIGLGASKFLTKPLRIRSLLRVIHDLIGIGAAVSCSILIFSEELNESLDLKNYLIRQGYEVHLAHISNKFRTQTSGHKPEIIILDFLDKDRNESVMMNALESSSEYADIPVIVLGSKRESSSFVKSLSNNASDYFAKPVDFPRLHSSIQFRIEKRNFTMLVESDTPAEVSTDDKELINAIATRKELRYRNQKSILLIEDDASLTENLRMHLELNRYAVLSAQNGERGIELACINLPDLIISDIILPGISGYDVRAYLNNKIITKNIPFLFLSAKVEYEDIRQGMDLGADDYLIKPVKTRELLRLIKKRIAGSVKNTESSPDIPVEEWPEQNVLPIESKAVIKQKNSQDSDSFRRTREIPPEQSNLPSESKANMTPTAPPPPVESIEKEVKHSSSEIYRKLEPLKGKVNPQDEYQSFKWVDGMVIRVNISCGVEKESAAFNKYLLEVYNKTIKNYIIDLTETEYLDASFMGVIVSFEKRAKKSNCRLKLVVRKELLMNNVIFLHGISRLFEVFNSVEEAIRSK